MDENRKREHTQRAQEVAQPSAGHALCAYPAHPASPPPVLFRINYGWNETINLAAVFFLINVKMTNDKHGRYKNNNYFVLAGLKQEIDI